MKSRWWVILMAVVLVSGLAPAEADAKRLGGGKSTGMQRDMPARTAPDAPPAKPATPAQQATPAQAGTPAAAPATPPKRSWMGPLAGLAAGLGLAALMSHLGLGEAFGSFLLMALVALVAVVVIRMVMRRMSPQPAAPMGHTAAAGGPVGQVAWPAPQPAAAEPARVAPELAASETAAAAPAAAAAAAPAERAFVPAAFDAEGFARTAKLIFIRLQAANDAADLDDLRSFTTPEMFAELSMDIRERGSAAQSTEVIDINAEVLDVARDATKQIVSVRFRGGLREAPQATPTAVDEVWHLVKPLDGERNWAVAGIEQWH